MTITVQAITPTMIPSRYSLTAVAKLVNDTVVHSLSVDRTTLFGSGVTAKKNVLQVSTNDSVRWDDLFTFNATGQGSETVQGVIETNDGEVLVASGNGAVVPGYIYKSSGWGPTLAQQQAATWSLVFTTRGGSFVDVWGFRQINVASKTGPYNGLVFVSVYNGGTTAGSSNDAAQATRPRYVYLSTSNGNVNTWTQILDIYTWSAQPNPGGVHVHSVCWQEAWGRIWVAFGDSTGAGQQVAGAGNCMILYSDDLGQTWTALPWPSLLTNTTAQFTASYATPSAMIFVADNTMGSQMNPILIMPITGYKTFGAPRLHPSPPSNSPYGKSLMRAGPTFPLIAGIAPDVINGMNPVEYPELLCSPDDASWYPLWKDPAPLSFHSGFYGAVTGPSVRGAIVAQYENGQLVGTLSGPS